MAFSIVLGAVEGRSSTTRGGSTTSAQVFGADGLVDYRRAADVIEASDLDYTIIRPAWLTNNDETGYELTRRDEQFKGTDGDKPSWS